MMMKLRGNAPVEEVRGPLDRFRSGRKDWEGAMESWQVPAVAPSRQMMRCFSVPRRRPALPSSKHLRTRRLFLPRRRLMSYTRHFGGRQPDKQGERALNAVGCPGGPVCVHPKGRNYGCSTTAGSSQGRFTAEPCLHTVSPPNDVVLFTSYLLERPHNVPSWPMERVKVLGSPRYHPMSLLYTLCSGSPTVVWTGNAAPVRPLRSGP